MEKKDKAIITVFLILFFGFSLMNFIVPTKGFSPSENRFLTQAPKFSKEALFDGRFTSDFEKYANDQFVFRDEFIGVNVFSQVALGKKDTNGVFFAKDGYLIEKHDPKDIDALRQQKNMESLSLFFENISKNKSIQSYSAMIVPTASVILSDKLPRFAVQYDQNAFLDTMQESFGSHFTDVRETLMDNADKYIYYKTDHHWTSLGAFLAYKEWCDNIGIENISENDFNVHTVSEDFLGTIYSKVQLPYAEKDKIEIYEPKNANHYDVVYNMQETSDSLYAYKYLEERDKYAFFLNGNNAIVEIKTGVKNGRNLLVIKDSYANSFVPFACQNFQNITVLDFRYFSGSPKQIIDEQNITDVIVLYNTTNFSNDKDIYKIKS